LNHIYNIVAGKNTFDAGLNFGMLQSIDVEVKKVFKMNHADNPDKKNPEVSVR